MTVRPGKKFGFQSAAEILQRRRQNSETSTIRTRHKKLEMSQTNQRGWNRLVADVTEKRVCNELKTIQKSSL